MKVTISAFFCLLCAFSYAEETKKMQWVRKSMNAYGWDTKDVSFQEVGRQAQPVIIMRSNKVVGYYFEESVWERRDADVSGLNEVTKIVFGYDRPAMPKLFEIDDADEVAIWVGAYQNHTEFERRFSSFVPTAKSAGFEIKRNEFQFGGACMCSLALRFYAKDKVVLELKGHIQSHSGIDSGMRNQVMHELAKAKIPKKEVSLPEVIEGETIDPFAAESETSLNKAEQDAAIKPQP